MKKYKILLFFDKIKQSYLDVFRPVKKEYSDLGYESLTPILLNPNKDGVKTYLGAINSALEDVDIKNIALTGSYGSGKSSLLKTFQEYNTNYEYLNISLASFKKETNGEGIERLIELSILQQIIYHVENKKIPDSRFIRIKHQKQAKLLYITIGLIIWSISLSILFQSGFSKNLLGNLINNKAIKYTSLLLFILGSFPIIIKGLRILSNTKLNKLNVQSGEIEVDNDLDKSILNKYLDEILYFFEVTNYNVVIFEDLDRFDKNTEVFTKLREINLLINNSQQIDKRVVFIYALKDEMFTGKNIRTKFFDFIIPIIPVINPSNSNEKLKNRINALNFKNAPDEEFLDDISLFIFDMRLLNNIINEYMIYKDNLSGRLNQNNLFAMIVYKNIYPDDFALLNKGEGDVFKVLNSKNEYISHLIKKYKTEIRETNDKISIIKNEKINNIKELRAIYINAIHNIIPEVIAIKIDNNIVYLSKLSEDLYFDKFINMDNITYYKYEATNYNRQFNLVNRASNKSFSDIEEFVNSELTYEERVLSINNEELDNLTERIKEIEKEINDIKKWTLKTIFNKIKLSEIYKEYSENKLMIYLLRNGFINEQYYDYISYFHEGSLTKNDFEFLQSVKSGFISDYNFKLNKLDNIIKKLQDKYFNTHYIFNLYLLDFLLENKKKYKDKFSVLFGKLSDNSKESKEFIKKYIEYKQISNSDTPIESVSKETKDIYTIFLIEISKFWNGFWNFVIAYDSFFSIQYIFEVIANNINNLESQNINNSISKYIYSQRDILNWETIDEKFKNHIVSLKIKFKELDEPTKKNKYLFDFVYNESHYQINLNMIRLMLKVYSNLELSSLDNSNYTTIINSNCKSLIDYIDKNINTYIEKVFLLLDNNKESEKSIVRLLNNKNLKQELKEKLIIKTNIIVSDLTQVKDNRIKSLFLEQNKVLNKWNNIFDYYDYNNEDGIFNKTLTNYLNKEENYIELSKFKINTTKKEKSYIDDFSLLMILNQDFHKNSFKHLIKSIPYTYNILEFETLSLEKIQIMIKSKFLNLTQSNYDRLKDNFPNEHIKLIEIHFNNFLNILDELDFDSDDLLLLLKGNNLTRKQYLKIIDRVEDELIIENENSCNIVCNILSKSDYLKLDYNLFYTLMKYSKSLDDRLNLLLIQFYYLKSNELEEVLNLLPEPYSKLTKPRHKPSFKYNQTNIKLLYNMLSKKLIYPFKQVKGKRIKVIVKYD